jgi:hypothetical protein
MVVLGQVIDAFGFFAASLIDEYEYLFGGENEIVKLVYNFQKAFEERLSKDGTYQSDDVIRPLQFNNGKPVTHQGT